MRISKKFFIFIYITSIIFFLFTGSGKSASAESHNSALGSTDKEVSEKAPILVSVYREKTGMLTTVPLESYVCCVVASEVPGSFHEEAIKAQAVAARTYVTAKLRSAKESGCPVAHPLAPVCDTTHCQVYDDAAALDRRESWSKVSDAVKATEGEMLYYDGELLEHALFHASSGGKTENSEDVFVSAVPYLKSVDSPYETAYSRNGHGVGMSQQGANGMALAGYSYEDILAHYYSGAYVR